MKNLNIINVIKNDYFSGSYEFKIELSTQGTSSDKCSDIKPATAETSEVMEKIITCTYSDKIEYRLGNKLTLTSIQPAVMQVFEITALGMIFSNLCYYLSFDKTDMLSVIKNEKHIIIILFIRDIKLI